MTPRVIVDGAEESVPARLGWWLWLVAIPVAVVVLLPGHQPPVVDDEVAPEGEWVLVELPGSGALHGVTTLPDGSYVAVGAGSQFWHSVDGTTWSRGSSGGHGPDLPLAVTALGEAVVAVGRAPAGDGSMAAAAWRSGDGKNWVASPLDAPRPSGFLGVSANSDRVLAWGFLGSERPFAPSARALLVTSVDGSSWQRVVGIPTAARIDAVRFLGGRWYVLGNNVGRPALWSSTDLTNWEQTETRGLPYGWTVTEIAALDPLTLNLVELGSQAVREWQRVDNGWAPGRGGPTGPFRYDGGLGVGWSGLWERQGDGSWGRLVLAGRAESVEAVAGEVAVGSTEGQPALWVRRPATAPTVEVTAAAGGRWHLAYEVGEGELSGAWRVGEGWLVSVGEEWWLLGRDGAESLADAPGGAIATVVRVGEEWLVAPGPWWSGDGHSWEGRTPVPWGVGERSIVAVAGDETEVMVVGYDDRRLWRWARSRDRGRSWESVPAIPTTPYRYVAGYSEGFVAMAVRDRNQAALVRSRDGLVWETDPAGGVLLPVISTPVVVRDSSHIELPALGMTIAVPDVAVTAAAAGEGQVLLVANQTLWVGPGNWQAIPLDPAHGLSAGWAHPLLLDGSFHLVASDRGQVGVYRWQP